MDDRTEGEILARLDYIERYLADIGRVTGYAYTSFATRVSGWSDEAPPMEEPFFAATGGPGVGGDIVAMAQAGRKIEAIKMYRQRTGVSLQQARDAVEQALIRGY